MPQHLMTDLWTAAAHDLARDRWPHLAAVAAEEARRMARKEGAPTPTLPAPIPCNNPDHAADWTR